MNEFLRTQISKELNKYLEKGFENLVLVISPDLENEVKDLVLKTKNQQSLDLPIIIDDEFEENGFEIEVENGS